MTTLSQLRPGLLRKARFLRVMAEKLKKDSDLGTEAESLLFSFMDSDVEHYDGTIKSLHLCIRYCTSWPHTPDDYEKIMQRLLDLLLLDYVLSECAAARRRVIAAARRRVIAEKLEKDAACRRAFAEMLEKDSEPAGFSC